MALAVLISTSQTLAHEGGWDEIAFVAVPVGIFALLLALAHRRARQSSRDRD